ncbi:NAD(P)/FAD-dependent oxidoreductase [Mangrovihabitans endophyticus]|uniref:NAD(P)/FAD-dependent oxidoreductase n=1 Tax=Mangrovihabitans endophyticus TaxID=1751298 RepID=UPI0016635286|nr:FAD-dependent oxidoreductase [Mangrovihabitans endophyticus]
MIVVGAGIAGLACARDLTAAGVPTRVLERGRVVGGRLASKRYDGRYADIGAAYLTADDPGFAGQLQSWRIAGLARPWTDTLRIFAGDGDGDGGGPAAASAVGDGRTARGPIRWAAPGGLRGLAENLARGLDVTLEHEVTVLPDADAVVLAMPGPQASRIAALEAAAAQRWAPALAAVLTYPDRDWAEFRGAFVNDHPVLATLCDDGDRRGDRAPVLVAHSTPQFAARHLDDPAAAGQAMAEAVSGLLRLGAPARTAVHRWTYATPEPAEGAYARHGRVYLAGDAYGKPRVQTAWLSGRAVAAAILRERARS